jgi:hypothetical protein
MRGAGLEARGDGDQEFRAFEVVGSREALTRKCSPARVTAEALNASAASGGVGTGADESESWKLPTMLQALGPGTERRLEGLQPLDGSSGPVHDPRYYKIAARSKLT